MSKYLKLFETTSEYEAYINGGGVVLPNVSVAKDAPKTVYFNPWVEPFFAKLSLNNGEVVELQGSGELTSAMVEQITQYQTSIVSAEIGELCTSIGEQAFYYCRGLTNVTIGSNVTSIGGYAFQGCTGLTSITIPDSVTSIGGYAFQGCTGLTSITIPSSVTSIGEYTFSNCIGLTSITIGSGLTSISNDVFSSCTSLTSIVVDSANTVYDSRDNCNAIIKTSTNELIAGCKNTVIPDSVTSIGRNAFGGCTGLTSIAIPDRVTSIGRFAFGNCTGLTNITIPNSVTSIGEFAFYNCSGLTSITSLAATAPTIKSSTFQEVKTNGTLTVPVGNTGYDVWMGTGKAYLGYYHWTKVEQ